MNDFKASKKIAEDDQRENFELPPAHNGYGDWPAPDNDRSWDS